MSKVPPGTKVTPGTRGEPLAYVTNCLAPTSLTFVGKQFGAVPTMWQWIMSIFH